MDNADRLALAEQNAKAKRQRTIESAIKAADAELARELEAIRLLRSDSVLAASVLVDSLIGPEEVAASDPVLPPPSLPFRNRPAEVLPPESSPTTNGNGHPVAADAADSDAVEWSGIRNVIRRVARIKRERFTMPDVRDYLKEHFPEQEPNFDPKDISSELYKMTAKTGELEVVEPGVGSRPNVYRLQRKSLNEI